MTTLLAPSGRPDGRPDSPPNGRHHALDWLRILAFGVLIAYHTGMYYVTWTFHIKSPNAGTGPEPWMMLSSPWRMDLLFLISGAATAFMWRGAAAPKLGRLRERAGRLLLPLAFGMLVIVPPQSWLEVVHKHGYGGSFADFMALYYTGYHGFCSAAGGCLQLPTWNHLWYLPYLAFYTLLLWLLLRLQPRLLDRLAQTAAPLLQRRVLLLALPMLWLLLTRLALRSRFPTTYTLVDDWFMNLQYFSMFMAGAVLARSPALPQQLQHARWPALLMALLGWAVLVGSPSAWREAGSPSSLLWLLRPLAYSTMQWCAVVAALGFGYRHLNDADNAWRRYLSDAVFPLYILHQTLIIVLAHLAARWALRPAAEAPLLMLATLALGLLGYEAVRRVRWLRPLFGLKRQAAQRAIEAASAQAPAQVPAQVPAGQPISPSSAVRS
jgi:glucan biosynthesis protein C